MKHENVLSEIFQIAGDAPELNMNNYTEEDVEKLNDAMIDIYNAAKVAFDPREPKEADISDNISNSNSIVDQYGTLHLAFEDELPCEKCKYDADGSERCVNCRGSNPKDSYYC